MKRWDKYDKTLLRKLLREAAIQGIAIAAAGALVRLLGWRTWQSFLTFMVPYALWWMFLWVAFGLLRRRTTKPHQVEVEGAPDTVRQAHE